MIEQNAPAIDALIDAMLTPRRLERAPGMAWGEPFRLDTPRGEIALWRAGTGPVVLLVHGWEGRPDDLAAFVAPLLAKGRCVMALDLPAHGASAGSTASLYDVADAVAHVGRSAGPLEAIIAHSMGAPASAMALTRGLRAERIAFLAAPRAYENYVRWSARQAGIPPETLVAAFARRGVDVTALDFEQTAAELTVPALFVHSSDDRTTPLEGARAVSTAWRGSTLRTVDGLGHTRILRDPPVVAEVVAFVTSWPLR